MSNWNVVLQKAVEVKRAFEKQFGKETLWDYTEKTCLDYWLSKLNRSDLTELFSYLSLSERDGLVVIHYNQEGFLTKHFWDIEGGFYRECRGLVLDMKEECIASVPYRKFFNYNELEETNLETPFQKMKECHRIEISEKLDGSMIAATYYRGELLLTSSKQISPENCIQLREAYRLLTPPQENMLKQFPEKTFLFELIAPDVDPHIVDYSEKKPGLYLTGIREKETGKEWSYQQTFEIARACKIPMTVFYEATAKDVEQLFLSLDKKKGTEAEGYVISLGEFRFKCKYSDYCLLHKASRLTDRALMEIYLEHRQDDFCSVLSGAQRSKVEAFFRELSDYETLVRSQVQKLTSEAKEFPTRKEAMLFIDANTQAPLTGFVKNAYLGKPWTPFGKCIDGKYVALLKIQDIRDYVDKNTTAYEEELEL